MVLVNELHLAPVGLVEYYPHYGLLGAHRAVDLGVHFVDGDRLALQHEGVEYVLAELFTLNDYLLRLGVIFGIEDGQGVDAVCFLGDAGCDRSGV